MPHTGQLAQEQRASGPHWALRPCRPRIPTMPLRQARTQGGRVVDDDRQALSLLEACRGGGPSARVAAQGYACVRVVG